VEGIEARLGGSPILKVRVRAALEDGAATNAARGALKSGAMARVKVLAVSGDTGALVAALDRLFSNERGP
jgi:hypothetical protein